MLGTPGEEIICGCSWRRNSRRPLEYLASEVPPPLRSKHFSRALRLPCIFSIVGLGLFGGLPISGCGQDGPTLSEVEKFDAYPLYYAGDEVEGNELDDISGEDNWQRNLDQRSVGFTFFYGTCELEGEDHPSCAPPIQIQVSSICDRHLGLYRGMPEVFDIRGAKASTNGGGLEIFTGHTTVVIFGDRELFKPTIRQLRPLGQDAPSSRLPPPVPGGVRGKLPCQQYKPR